MDSRSNDIDQETISRLREKEGIPIFNQICRVCLSTTINESDQQLNKKIHVLLNNVQEIRSLLEESTGLQIIDSEFLPNHICYNCSKTLIAWYKLRSQTQRSNEILKKYLKELETLLDKTSQISNSDLTIHIMQGDKLKVVPIPKQSVYEIEDIQVSVLNDKPEIVGFVLHCDSCTMTYTNQMDLEKHQEEHITKPTKEKSFKCKHCSQSFEFRNGLSNHMIFHYDSKSFKFRCDRCEKIFNTFTGVKVHKRKPCVPVGLIEQCKTRLLDVRKEDLIAATEKVIRETKISCILCKKNFKNQDDFIDHYSEHKKDRKCHICHKAFDCFKFLETHVRKHLRAKVYACPRCSRSFYACRLFRAHMLEHGKIDFVYKCNECQKEFFQVIEFKRHMLKHYLKDENKTFEEVKNNDVVDTVEMENVDIIEIDSESEPNTLSLDDSTDKIETEISKCQEPFQQVEIEVEAESKTMNQPEKDTSINIPKIKIVESLAHSRSQFEADITTENESSNQVSQTTATDLSVFQGSVKLKTPILVDSSSEEENVDETDDDTNSTLSKSNDQIAKNYSSSMQDLLNKCNLNCHIADCNTNCSSFSQIWEHFRKDHLKEYPYKCSTCFEQFDHKETFKNHIRKYYSYKCPVCSEVKINSSDLKRHVIHCHSNDRSFMSLKCPRTFAGASYLKCHEIRHNSKGDFVCKVCSKKFVSSRALYRHSKCHKIGNECDSNTLSQVDSKNESINQKETEFASCQKPLNLVKMEEDSESHTSQKPEKNESIQKGMDLSVDIMDSKEQLQSVDNNPSYTNDAEVKALIDILKLEDHTSDNSSEKEEENTDEIVDDIKSNLSKPNDHKISTNRSAYVQELLDKCKLTCYVAGCQTKVSNIAEIYEHIGLYHLLKNNPYKCCTCLEQFDNKMAFKHHIKNHYTFQCPVCPKIKACVNQLRTHVIVTHSNERSFQCSKCPKNFVSLSNLKAHEIIHNSERNFVCKFCSKNYFCLSSLYKHTNKNHKNGN